MNFVFKISICLFLILGLSANLYAAKSGPIQAADQEDSDRSSIRKHIHPDDIRKIKKAVQAFCDDLENDKKYEKQDYKCDSYKNKSNRIVYRVDMDSSRTSGDLLLKMTVSPLFIPSATSVSSDIKKVSFKALRLSCQIDTQYKSVSSFIDSETSESTDAFKQTILDCMNSANLLQLANQN